MKLGISNRNLCAFLSADSDRGGLRMYASAHFAPESQVIGWLRWRVRRGLRPANMASVRLFLILYPRLLGWLKICGDVGGMVASKTKLSNSSAGALLQDGASQRCSLALQHDLCERPDETVPRPSV